MLPQALDDVEEFPGAAVALVMVEEVTLGTLAGRVATRDDVPVQAAVAQVLKDGSLLRGIGGKRPGGLEGNQKADASGLPGQGRGDDPRLGAGGQQCAFKAGQLGGFGHLGDVIDVGKTVRLTVGSMAGRDMPWA